MNSNRLWAVVNIDTNDVLYSSFDYNRSKRAYDEIVKPVTRDGFPFFPSVGDLWRIRFVRYDINRAYVDDQPHVSTFQKSLNDDFRAFMDFCLMKRGQTQTQTETQTQTNKG